MSVVENGQVVSSVISGSLAEELDIRPGDRLLCIDGKPVIDVFDYQVRQLQADLVILIEKLDKSQIEFELEKDEDEDLGLVFENPLLDDCNSCQNHCIFCFIDQLPQGLRKTLYFKDDDMRMSFLHGNYVTLTNIDDEELDRIISYRFSPMNISVHATDRLVRMRMMRNRNSGNLYPRLKKLAAAGIDLNCQLVLCPGINDGEVLENTLSDLTALGQNVISIAMVPVGVTKYREEKNLFPVRSFSKEEAQNVINTVNKWQNKLLDDWGRRTVYAGDEFYLRSGVGFPPANEYEEYPQLENGVGMAALFIDTVSSFLDGSEVDLELPPLKIVSNVNSIQTEALDTKISNDTGKRILIATGSAASEVISPWVGQLAAHFSLDIELITVLNDFFGHTVTVAGLITGQDLITTLKPIIKSAQAGLRVIIPDCMLKADEDIFLDDVTLQQLADELKCEVAAVSEQAQGLLAALTYYSMEEK
jgi:putative radical SAM enzyme (TIGR03279 family)